MPILGQMCPAFIYSGFRLFPLFGRNSRNSDFGRQKSSTPVPRIVGIVISDTLNLRKYLKKNPAPAAPSFRPVSLNMRNTWIGSVCGNLDVVRNSCSGCDSLSPPLFPIFLGIVGIVIFRIFFVPRVSGIRNK